MLYNRDARFAHLLMALLKRKEELVVGDNEPYSVTDALDYTIPVHGERRGLHHVAIEVRHDLIADEKGQRAWGTLLARLLPQSYQELVAAEALRPGNNVPRIGRVLMARGRDAIDVAISTTFGPNTLLSFKVWTDEVKAA